MRAPLVEGHVVRADALVQGRELPELRPAPRGLERGLHVGVHAEAPRSHGGQDGTARVGHEPERLEPAHALLVELGPGASGLAGREALQAHAADLLVDAVHPAEAERLLDGVEVPEHVLVRRAAASDLDPAFDLDGVVSLEPLAECAPVPDVGEYVRGICFHGEHYKGAGGWLPSSLV